MSLIHRTRDSYTELVKRTLPTYYWSMQPIARSRDDAQVWAPDAGSKLLRPSSDGVGSESGPYEGQTPAFGFEIAHSGMPSTAHPLRCFETPDGGVTASVNANRNTTGYSYAIWARNTDTALSDRAYCGNWTTNAGSMLYVHTGSDLRVYHNGSFSGLVGYKDALWHHWCVTWDGTTQLVYRDGAVVNTVARAGALASAVRLSVGYYNFSLATVARMAACHFAWWENRALDPGTVGLLARIY